MEQTGEKFTKDKSYYETHKEARRAYNRSYLATNRDALKAKCKSWNLFYKLECLSAYCENREIACACCGETWPVFLAIDHINGGGATHRRSFRGPLYTELRKKGYPKGFQVLCHNCNHAKHVKAVCPHQSTGGRKP